MTCDMFGKHAIDMSARTAIHDMKPCIASCAGFLITFLGKDFIYPFNTTLGAFWFGHVLFSLCHHACPLLYHTLPLDAILLKRVVLAVYGVFSQRENL
jgi:hypothetical protein